VRFTVPLETGSCRFTIGYRSPTPQEHCRELLARWGLWQRFPILSARISDWLPNKERWTECRREVRLPRVPLEQEPHDTSEDANRADQLLRSVFRGNSPAPPTPDH